MAEVTIRHEIEVDEDTFWDKCVFDDEYNRRLYLDELKFQGYTALDDRTEGDKRTKKVRLEPPVSGMPAPVQKAIGGKTAYVEEGTYDKATRKYRAEITPAALPEKSTMWAELWTERLGDKKIARFVKVHVEVKVFMVGSLIEDRIMANLRNSYDTAARFTVQFAREKGYV